MNNKEKINAELKSFCENIEKCFQGNEENQDVLFKEILSGFSPDFKMINGDGNTATLGMLADWLPTVFGKFPDRKVQVDSIEIHCSEYHGLAAYTEIQITEGKVNRRKSSAVFLLNEEQAFWHHLVETWI